MSEEEKKAIEWLKKADWFSTRLYSSTILNLIENQQKEIEGLKEKEKNLLIQLKDNEKELLEVCENLRNSVSKDKIRAKIKKYDEWLKDSGEYEESLEAQRYALNELLEE